MSYLIFILASGLFALLGSAGPLHRDEWVLTLSRRIEGLSLGEWVATGLLVIGPLLLLVVGYGVLGVFLGEFADWLVGLIVLYFSWGRGDYPTDLQRFIARARDGDRESVIEVLHNNNQSIDGDSILARVAIKAFAYRGFERWFPPTLYFFLLGPAGAAFYRVTQIVALQDFGVSRKMLHILDWIPSRLVLFTFAVLGDFEKTRILLGSALSNTVVTAEELLSSGVEKAWQLELDTVDEATALSRVGEAIQKAIYRSCGVWIILASLAVLF